MIVKQLTEHHFEFPSLKGGCRDSSETHLSLHMSKCHIVGNLMHWLNYYKLITSEVILMSYGSVHPLHLIGAHRGIWWDWEKNDLSCLKVYQR